MRWLLESGAFVVSAALGLFAASLLLRATGTPVLGTFNAIFTGALSSGEALQGSLVYTVPIAFTGLAASVAFRAQVWNIGAEGQAAMGAFGSALVALHWPLPAGVMLVAVIVVGTLCGAFWGLVPAVLKVWLGVNEVLSSLMLNYVAILWVDYLVYGPWHDPSGGWPYSKGFPRTALLPAVGSDLNISIFIAPLIALLISVLLRYTRWGFEISVVGHSHAAAKYAGISVARTVLWVMLLSGAIAGYAGVDQVAGTAGRLYHLTPGYGYIGILVSWLADHNPLLVLLTAFFYGVLLQGGSTLQMTQVDASLVQVMQGLIILFALAGMTSARRLAQRMRIREVAS